MTEIRVEHDIRIPMRDGVNLAANVYLPPAAGPAPALLWYTPYLKDGMGGLGFTDVAQRFFAERGYASVSLDFRGYGESEGVPPPAFADQEAIDGHDALEWIARQPWCTGRTGIWGASYGGNTALSIAALRPLSLGAIVPIHAIDTEFTGAAWPHGCRGALVGEIDWGFRMIGIQLLPPLRFTDGWQERWRARLAAIERPFPFAWHTIPPETWKRWTTDIAAIEVPTLAVSAWHDSYPGETVDYYARLKVPKRLILGPWKHELPDIATHDRIGFFEVAAAWFGRWLREEPAGSSAANGAAELAPAHDAGRGATAADTDLAPVTFFETLGRGWRTAESWPPPTSPIRTLFAHADGGLAETADDAPSERAYVVNPTVGLAALPWDWTTPTPATPPDISPDDHRAMTWTAEPNAQPLQITGVPAIIVALRSDRPDVPLRAWLSDVRPDGSSTLITHGWVRPTHVIGALLPADHAVQVRVPLSPTCYRLPAGHRLRVAVAGSHFPALVPAPDRATFHVATGPNGTRLELPTEPFGADTGPTPRWPVAITGNPTASLEVSGRHTVERSLDDQEGRYRQTRRVRTRLEGGAELTWDLDSSATVMRDDPGAMRLESRQTWRVIDGPTPIEIRLDRWQTFDQDHVTAEIDVDGRRFFARQWEQRFEADPWRIRR